MLRRYIKVLRRVPFVKGAYFKLLHFRRLYRLRQQIRNTSPLRVILGAGGTTQDGWISTDQDVLDITSSWNWRFLFKVDSIRSLLIEHVLEHLSEEECEIALSQCYRYLSSEGTIRIAVPDGYRRDPTYVAEVTPPKDGHKMLFTVDTLVPLLERLGLQVSPLEYFDSQQQFRANEWNPIDGYIARSKRFDRQQAFQRDNLFYTSLIVDAKKK